MRTKRFLAIGAMALGLVAIILGLSMRLRANDAQAAATDPGDATFTVNAPAGSQTVGVPFTVTIDMSAVSFGPATTTWAGYDVDLGYDSSFLSHSTITHTLCPTANSGASSAGKIISGCYGQSSSALSGNLETITMTCTGNGTSNLTLWSRSDPNPGFNGTALFDGYSAGFNMTLVSDTVVCGTGVSGPTNTPTATATATRTNTPTATNTPCDPVAGCPTNTPTNTPTATNSPGSGIYSTATPTGTRSPEAGTETATSVPGQPTNTSVSGGTGNLPGGGAGGAGVRPRITLPDTGSGPSGGDDALGGLWLIVAGIALATLGGGMFVTARKRA